MGKKFLFATAIVAGVAVGVAAIVAAVEHMKVKRLEDMLDEEFDDFDFEEEESEESNTATTEFEERAYVKAPMNHECSESEPLSAESEAASETEYVGSDAPVDDSVDADDFLEEEQDAYVDGIND